MGFVFGLKIITECILYTLYNVCISAFQTNGTRKNLNVKQLHLDNEKKCSAVGNLQKPNLF